MNAAESKALACRHLGVLYGTELLEYIPAGLNCSPTSTVLLCTSYTTGPGAAPPTAVHAPCLTHPRPAAPALHHRYQLTSFQSGLVVSMSLLGALAGSVAALAAGNRLGRKVELMTAAALYGELGATWHHSLIITSSKPGGQNSDTAAFCHPLKQQLS